MKTLRFDFSKGLNQIRDMRINPEGFVAYMENADVRSGAISPVYVPKVDPLRTPPDGTQFLFVYRGKYWYSPTRREWATDIFAGREVIYYTQYGGGARKIVEGLDVPLGTPAPLYAPQVTPGILVSPLNISATLNPAGQFTVGVVRRYRLAIVTGGTTLQASAPITIQVTGTASTYGIQLAWSVPAAGFPIDSIKIYGTSGVEGSERLIATVVGNVTFFEDNGSVGQLGELATTFDQENQTAYVQTFTRMVNGIVNESGPSPLSTQTITSGVRTLAFNPSTDGLNIYPDYVQWGVSPSSVTTWPSLTLAPTRALVTSSTATQGIQSIACTSIGTDPNTGRIIIAAAGHSFCDGEYVLAKGLLVGGSDPFGGIPFPVKLIVLTDDGNGNVTYDQNNFYAYPDNLASVTNTTTAFTCVRTIWTQINSATYDSATRIVELQLSDPVAFNTDEYAYFQIPSDSSWDGQRFQVVRTLNDPTKLLIKNAAIPTISGAGIFIWKQISTLTLSAPLIGAHLPASGDAGFMSIPASTPVAGVSKFPAVNGTFTLATSPNPLIIYLGVWYENVPMDTTTYTLASVPGFGYLWKNGFILWRNIYRIGGSDLSTGGTSEFRFVTQLPLTQGTYQDIVPDNYLGAILNTSYIAQTGEAVVFQPPPADASYITAHDGKLFCISGNRVYWTPIGQPDAWPAAFYKQFSYRPMALASFGGSLVVLCEDNLYRLSGEDPETMAVSVTRAGYGCKAPYSVQAANHVLLYLSDVGIMAFDGNTATILTELRVQAPVWTGTSVYVNEPLNPGDSPTNFSVNNFLVPTRQSALYRNIIQDAQADYDVNQPPFIRGTASTVGPIFDIRSFYQRNKYYLYWPFSAQFHQAHTMVCLDLQAPGTPLVTMSMKPQDVCVADDERAYALIPFAQPTYPPTIVNVSIF